jgi:5-methylcytosine-specific restriction endonuclease McrA
MTGWRSQRYTIYRRDRGMCQVCGSRVGRMWDIGHLVDRCVGGSDDPSNLVLMCAHCNRVEKPITPTRAEALAWLAAARERARTGREIEQDWRPAWEAQRRVFGRAS